MIKTNDHRPMVRFYHVIARSIALLLVTLHMTIPSAFAATLNRVTNFGDNPGNLEMYIYIPDGLTGTPPILVAIHWCHGNARDMYNANFFNPLADQYGFMVIFPSSDGSDGCFDVATQPALTRDGGSDPVSIMSMVNYAIQNYGGDPNQIYASGISSGAMMTNVMLGLYPDVFRAGAAYAGVPFGCFATTDGSTWNSDCASGNIVKTPQEWGDLSRNQNPDYNGPWPRMQLWHGTDDETVNYVNFGEEIEQWTNINGLSQTPDYIDSPQSDYTRTRYGGSGPNAPVEAISIAGSPHNLPVDASEAIRFFGLDENGSSGSSSGGSSSGSGGGSDLSCSVSVNDWGGGFVASFTVTNDGSSSVSGWSVGVSFGTSVSISNSWGVSLSGSGSSYTASNVDYNGNLGSGASTSFGMQGSPSPGSVSCTSN